MGFSGEDEEDAIPCLRLDKGILSLRKIEMLDWIACLKLNPA